QQNTVAKSSLLQAQYTAIQTSNQVPTGCVLKPNCDEYVKTFCSEEELEVQIWPLMNLGSLKNL
ncbi:1052_t:CDS:1, partial [Dentiscutata erythropus]